MAGNSHLALRAPRYKGFGAAWDATLQEAEMDVVYYSKMPAVASRTVLAYRSVQENSVKRVWFFVLTSPLVCAIEHNLYAENKSTAHKRKDMGVLSNYGEKSIHLDVGKLVLRFLKTF